MLTSVRNFKTSQALPRMLADFALVQISMIVALGDPRAFPADARPVGRRHFAP